MSKAKSTSNAQVDHLHLSTSSKICLCGVAQLVMGGQMKVREREGSTEENLTHERRLEIFFKNANLINLFRLAIVWEFEF